MAMSPEREWIDDVFRSLLSFLTAVDPVCTAVAAVAIVAAVAVVAAIAAVAAVPIVVDVRGTIADAIEAGRQCTGALLFVLLLKVAGGFCVTMPM